MGTQCCQQPFRVLAPVDRLSPTGIRLRHIPAEVCLNCRRIDTAEISPSISLRNSIIESLQSDLTNPPVVKAFSHRKSLSSSICLDCSSPLDSASLDIGFGENAGLVTENIQGFWCWRCRKGILPDKGDELRKRLENFSPHEKVLETVSLTYDTPSHPRSVQFEITTRCNLKCSYCTHRLLSEKTDASFRHFENLLANIDLDYLDNIDFTGLGEPVLHPELPQMVHLVRKLSSPSHIRVVTNGTVLSKERFEPLCDAGITSIAFSLDSLDAEKFARNRSGASLPIVLRNLENLVQYREKNSLSNLSIKIKAVLTDNIYEEAERLLAYSAQTGLEMPHFSCLDTRENVQNNYTQNFLQSNWGKNKSPVFSVWAKARWDQLSPEGNSNPDFISYPTISDRAVGFIHPILSPGANLCCWIVDAVFVSLNGSCLSCCEQMIDVPRNTWGKISETSLRKTLER